MRSQYFPICRASGSPMFSIFESYSPDGGGAGQALCLTVFFPRARQLPSSAPYLLPGSLRASTKRQRCSQHRRHSENILGVKRTQKIMSSIYSKGEKGARSGCYATAPLTHIPTRWVEQNFFSLKDNFVRLDVAWVFFSSSWSIREIGRHSESESESESQNKLEHIILFFSSCARLNFKHIM